MRVAAAYLALLGIREQAVLGHDVDPHVLPGNVLRAARPDPVQQAESGAVLGDPLRTVRTVRDIGHAFFQFAPRLRDEKVGWHPRHVEMAIGRDSAVLHVSSPLYEGSDRLYSLGRRIS